MKTIKLIDLFIKIANGEDTPKKIDFNGDIYSHNGIDNNSYYYCNENNKLLEDVFIFEELNDEVEIIEDTPKEDKKIEKFYFSVYQDEKLGGREVVETLENKINEIIDYINKENK